MNAQPRASARPTPLIRHLGRVDYQSTWQRMQQFTDTRTALSADELWFLEHPPVFTLGMAGRREHLLAPGAIPVVHTDRGGQVTYHGPGQLVVYALIDLRRAQLGVRDLVTGLEQAVVRYAAELGVTAAAQREAPGVYVEGRKLASVGIRIRRHASYHGLALNVDMDLKPFGRINPCGYEGLAMTQLRALTTVADVQVAAAGLTPHLLAALGFAPVTTL
ncbi:MAG TPA: lipoyl(octanoyl) transferase LipB [Steroidobacteraceae bacterium]